MDDRLVRWAFETHAPSLHRYATRLTGDPDLAEDLVQEAFIRIADASGIENEKAWLFRVVSNLASNANRLAGRRRGLLRLMGHHQPMGAWPGSGSDRNALYDPVALPACRQTGARVGRPPDDETGEAINLECTSNCLEYLAP